MASLYSNEAALLLTNPNEKTISIEINNTETIPIGTNTPKVTNMYNYVGIGFGIPNFLSAKFGHRKQVDHYGFEFGFGVSPLVAFTEVHLFGSYLYYPKPNLLSQT